MYPFFTEEEQHPWAEKWLGQSCNYASDIDRTWTLELVELTLGCTQCGKCKELGIRRSDSLLGQLSDFGHVPAPLWASVCPGQMVSNSPLKPCLCPDQLFSLGRSGRPSRGAGLATAHARQDCIPHLLLIFWPLHQPTQSKSQRRRSRHALGTVWWGGGWGWRRGRAGSL